MPNLLEAARKLRALAQTGLTYGTGVFDRERYAEIRDLADGLLAGVAGTEVQRIKDLFLPEQGYANPKIDVRAAVFRDGKLLLVQERADGKWSLPGGWADVGMAPAACVEKEVYEESGLTVKAVKLLGCLDKLKHQHPPELLHSWKIFFRCEVVGGELTPSVETSGAAFFAEHEIPPLSEPRVTLAQVQRMFQHARESNLPADFD